MHLRQSLIICSFLITALEKPSQREADGGATGREGKVEDAEWLCPAHPVSQEQSPGLSDIAEYTFYKTGSFSSVTWHEAQSGFSLWIWHKTWVRMLKYHHVEFSMHCVNISAIFLFGSALWSLDMCLRDKSHKLWALCSLSWSTVCSDVLLSYLWDHWALNSKTPTRPTSPSHCQGKRDLMNLRTGCKKPEFRDRRGHCDVNWSNF